MDNYWWNYVSGPRRLIKELVSRTMDNDSVVFITPPSFPWDKDCIDYIKERIQKNDPGESVIQIHDIVSGVEDYMFENYCKKEIRAKYRPKPNYDKAYFLAEIPSIPLHTKHFIITIKEKVLYGEWKTFISHYLEKAKQCNIEPATFLLVVDSTITSSGFDQLDTVHYNAFITDYDLYTYCALLVSETKETEHIKAYLTELLISICGKNIEYADVLMEDPKQFLTNPEEVIKSKNPDLAPDATTAIWEAQIKCIFPYLEKYRHLFITKYREKINACLPIVLNSDISYQEAEDVELGSLYYLANNRFTIDPNDIIVLEAFKNARNLLAHLTPLPYSDIIDIFKYYTD